jgi:uncharacterized phage protein (TIGR02218 family)
VKSINPAMLTHLASEVTTLATILKLTRGDGVVMGFTDHDRDITVGGVTYEAAIGYTRSALSSKSDLSVDNLQVAGVIDSAGIADVDVRAGVYDYARASKSRWSTGPIPAWG